MNEQDPTSRIPQVGTHRVSSAAPQPQPWPVIAPKHQPKHSTRKLIIWAVAMFILGGVLGQTPRTTTGSTSAGPQVAATSAAAPSSAPAGPATAVADGTYEVGADVVPGKWKTPGGESFCFWSVKDDAGTILDLGSGAGPQVVNLKQGRVFDTRSCGTWKRQ